MLLFWRLIFKEDAYLFAKDPSAANLTHNITYSPTHTDHVLSFSLGLFFIIPWASSSLLNPLLFWHFNRHKSKANTLFKLLTVSDFCTNLIMPVAYTWMLCSSRLYASSTPGLFQLRILTCSFGCVSQGIAFLLALTRLLKICLPFRRISQRWILGYLACYTLYMTANNGLYFVADQWFRQRTDLLKIGMDLCFWANFVHVFSGLGLSIAGSLYLGFMSAPANSPTHAIKIAGSITIVLMNIPYFATVVMVVILMWVVSLQISYHEILFAWIPIITSALNPLIIIARRPDIRNEIIRELILRRDKTYRACRTILYSHYTETINISV